MLYVGFSDSSDGKETACNAGDLGSITGLERSPREGHDNPFQYSCLENPHGQRCLAGYSPQGHKELDTIEQLRFLSMLPSGHPWWLSGKESACSAGDLGSVPGLGRSPGGGHGNSLQYSYLENPMNRGAWRASLWGCKESHN